VSRAGVFFNNSEGKAFTWLDESRVDKGLSCILPLRADKRRVRRWRKHTCDGGSERAHSYGVKRLSACGGCLGDYRR
jgi:hypothetical protein